MNYDELWWIMMNYDADELCTHQNEIWHDWTGELYPPSILTSTTARAITERLPRLPGKTDLAAGCAMISGTHRGCGCVGVCWKPHDNLSKMGPKMSKTLENGPKNPTTFKYSRKLSQNIQNNGWLMGWYQLTHGWHRQTPQIITYRIFFLTNKVTASESNQTYLEANTCQSILYSSHLLKIGEAANISTKPQTIQKNSLTHCRILLYMGGKNHPINEIEEYPLVN